MSGANVWDAEQKRNTYGADFVRITLTRDEFETLIFALGYSAGAANVENPRLAASFLAVVNAVNRGNPNFRSYPTASDTGDDTPRTTASEVFEETRKEQPR